MVNCLGGDALSGGSERATRLMSRFVWAGRVAADERTVVACARKDLGAVQRVCKVKAAEDGRGGVGWSDGEDDGRESDEAEQKGETPGASRITAHGSCATSGSLSLLPKAQPRVTTIAPTSSKWHNNGSVAEWL